MSVTAPPRAPSGDDDPEALIEEARQHARHRRRRRGATAAITAGLGFLLILAWTTFSGSGSSPRTADRRFAGADVGPSGVRYLYTRAIVAPSNTVGQTLVPQTTTVESWVGTDGSWRLRETVPNHAAGSLEVIVSGDGLLPPQTNADGAFDGVPVNTRDPGDGLFTASQIDALPLNTTRLTARVRDAITAQDLRNLSAYVLPGPRRASQLQRLRPVFLQRQIAQTLLAIADLNLTPIPHPLIYALYRVARNLPGVRVTSTPAARGQHDETIAGGGFSLTFDPGTGALRSSSTGTFFNQGSAGTIVAQGTVASLDAMPKGLAQVPSLIAHPPTIALTPHTGAPATHLTLHMVLAHPSASAAAPRLFAEMFGPTGPNCGFWASRPPSALIAPGTVAHDKHQTLATYRISPEAIGRSSWCPGRYQLMLSTLKSTQPIGTPRSFAATYFSVR